MFEEFVFVVVKVRITKLHAWIQRGGGGGGTGGPDPLFENDKIVGFFSNTGSDPLKNHKAFKPAFNV